MDNLKKFLIGKQIFNQLTDEYLIIHDVRGLTDDRVLVSYLKHDNYAELIFLSPMSIREFSFVPNEDIPYTLKDGRYILAQIGNYPFELKLCLYDAETDTISYEDDLILRDKGLL